MKQISSVAVGAVLVAALGACASSGGGDAPNSPAPSPVESTVESSRVAQYALAWGWLDDPSRNSAFVEGVPEQLCGYWNDPATLIASEDQAQLRQFAKQEPEFSVWKQAALLMSYVAEENGSDPTFVEELRNSSFSVQQFRRIESDATQFFESVC